MVTHDDGSVTLTKMPIFKRGNYVRYIGSTYPGAKNQIFKVKDCRKLKSGEYGVFLQHWDNQLHIPPDELVLIEGHPQYIESDAAKQIHPDYRQAVETAIDIVVSRARGRESKAYIIYIDGVRILTPKYSYRSKDSAFNQLCEYLSSYIWETSPDGTDHIEETKLIVQELMVQGRIELFEVICS